ncbi:MAG: hypothetical protein NWE98_04710 [Candidatus Bathyarchaeota archaeon]|nr:hypothetical protein [Candidatus Bathyarchaeota archaeon]
MDPTVTQGILADLSDEIIVLKLDDFIVAHANRSLLEALKAKRGDVIGRTCFEVTYHR